MGERTASAAETSINLLGGFSVTVAGRPVADRWRLRKAKTRETARPRARASVASGHRDNGQRDADPLATANNLHQLIHYPAHDEQNRSHSATTWYGSAPAGLTVDVEVFERAAADALRTGGITELQAQWSMGRPAVARGPVCRLGRRTPGIDSMKPMPPW